MLKDVAADASPYLNVPVKIGLATYAVADPINAALVTAPVLLEQAANSLQKRGEERRNKKRVTFFEMFMKHFCELTGKNLISEEDFQYMNSEDFDYYYEKIVMNAILEKDLVKIKRMKNILLNTVINNDNVQLVL